MLLLLYCCAMRKMPYIHNCTISLCHSSTLSVQHWRWWVYHLCSYSIAAFKCFDEFVITVLMCTHLEHWDFCISHERHLLALSRHCYLILMYQTGRRCSATALVLFYICFLCLDFVSKSASLPGYRRNGLQRVRLQREAHDMILAFYVSYMVLMYFWFNCYF